MKKILLFLAILFLASSSFADNRVSHTITTYKPGTSTLVKRGDTKVYSINFIATASNGNFIILNALTDTTVSPGGVVTDVKAEGGQATSGNTYIRDYLTNPLELSTGLYLIVTGGNLILEYD